jgi:hypothetical protein
MSGTQLFILKNLDMQTELMLRIVLEKPPAGVDFGLQKGSGSNYETIQKQRSNGSDLYFELKVGIKESKNSMPAFTGAFVQGPTGEKFIYVDIGTFAGQTSTEWSRRLKIPLKDISWQMINELTGGLMIFETRIPGTGKDGGPTCGTAKPFNGWKLVNIAQ